MIDIIIIVLNGTNLMKSSAHAWLIARTRVYRTTTRRRRMGAKCCRVGETWRHYIYIVHDIQRWRVSDVVLVRVLAVRTSMSFVFNYLKDSMNEIIGWGGITFITLISLHLTTRQCRLSFILVDIVVVAIIKRTRVWTLLNVYYISI